MPFQYENYRSPYISSIAELMKAPAEQQAQLQVQLAAIQGRQLETNALIKARAYGNVGQAAANIGEGLERDRREAPARQYQQLQLGQAKQELVDNQVLRQAMSMPPEQAQKYLDGLGPVGVGAKQKYAGVLAQQREQQKKLQAEHDNAWLPFAQTFVMAKDPLAAWNEAEPEMIQRGVITPENAAAYRQQFGGDAERVRSLGTMRLNQTDEGRKALREISDFAPGHVGINPLTGQTRITVAPSPQQQTEFSAALTATKGDVQAALKLVHPHTASQWEDVLASKGGNVDEALKAMRAPVQPVKQEREWIKREVAPGKWQEMWITADQYQPGDRRDVGGNAQARPMVSGDANRIADMTTSLAEAGALNDIVKDPGTGAKLLSVMPNFVSNIAGGWSNDAKDQNAVIATVRQIIGKSLEGGVLRKEDEYKYKEILPELGENKALVTVKIQRMYDTIERKRSDLLNALEDSGYDVSAHRKRPIPLRPGTQTRTIQNKQTGETKTQTSTDGGATWK